MGPKEDPRPRRDKEGSRDEKEPEKQRGTGRPEGGKDSGPWAYLLARALCYLALDYIIWMGDGKYVRTRWVAVVPSPSVCLRMYFITQKNSNAGPPRGPGPYMDNYLHIDYIHMRARVTGGRLYPVKEKTDRAGERVHHDTGNPLWVTQEEHRDPEDL